MTDQQTVSIDVTGATFTDAIDDIVFDQATMTDGVSATFNMPAENVTVVTSVI